MPYGTGLDIGAYCTKAVRVAVVGDKISVISATCFARQAAPPQERAAGTTARKDEPAAPLVPDGLGAALAGRRLGRRFAVGLSGRDVMMRYVSSPPASPDRLRKLIEFEVVERLPKDFGSVAYDFRPLMVSGGAGGELISLVAVTRDEALQRFCETLKSQRVSAEYFCPSALALWAAFSAAGKHKKEKTSLVLDIGHDTLDMVLQKDGLPVLARSVSGSGGAGRDFTSAIDSVLGFGPAKAEQYKHRKAAIETEAKDKERPQEEDTGKARGASARTSPVADGVRKAAGRIVAAISAAVRLCRSQAGLKDFDFERLYVCGGGARLTGLREYLGQHTGKPVEVFDVFEDLDTSGLSPEGASVVASYDMNVALGLAIGGASPGVFQVRLLPAAEKRRHRFLDEGIFAYGAAVAAGLLAAVMLVSSLSGVSRVRKALSGLKHRSEEIKLEVEGVRRRDKENSRRRARATMLAEEAFFGRAVTGFLAHLNEATPEVIELHKVEAGRPGRLGRRAALGRTSRTYSAGTNRKVSAKAGQVVPFAVIQMDGVVSAETPPQAFDVLENYLAALESLPHVVSVDMDTGTPVKAVPSPAAAGLGSPGGGDQTADMYLPFKCTVRLASEKEPQQASDRAGEQRGGLSAKETARR